MAEQNSYISENSEDARSRLLVSAEKHFADKGFASTSIKEITEEAGCNIAAVNYHFGNKENLYFQVFQRRISFMHDGPLKSVKELMSKEKGRVTLEKLLRVFAEGFLKPLLYETDHGRFMRLMLRERLDPRLHHSMFFKELISPVFTELKQALQKIEPNLTEQQAISSVRSFIAQLVDVIRHTHKHSEDDEVMEYWREDINNIIEHIVKFSAAGIRGVKKIKK